jgi:hypothetical protein
VNDSDNLNASGFDPQNPTKIIVHGFGGGGENSVIIESKDGEYTTC